jgi:hypothetical protein
LRQPAKQLKARVIGHRGPILDQRKHLVAARPVGLEARDILDRARGHDDGEPAALTVRAFGKARRDRVVLSARSPRQDGCPQVAVVPRNAERTGDRRERGRNAQQQQNPQQSFSAPPLG